MSQMGLENVQGENYPTKRKKLSNISNNLNASSRTWRELSPLEKIFLLISNNLKREKNILRKQTDAFVNSLHALKGRTGAKQDNKEIALKG